MRHFFTILAHEVRMLIVSPSTYIAAVAFLALMGFNFTAILEKYSTAPQDASPASVLFDVYFLPVIFMVPLLTMKCLAEERRLGTMELLMTSPITELQIVFGKFLASLTLFAAMLLPTAGCLIFVWMHSDPVPPFRIVLCGYLGTLLFGGSLLALGSFLSSLTENQIIAAALTFAAFLLLWAIDFGAQGSTGMTAQILQYLSVINHYDDFTRGIIDTAGVTYYVSFMVLFIFLTVRSVDSMRWRRA